MVTAFGQLKGRWEYSIESVRQVKSLCKSAYWLAYIALHNICIEKGDLITQNLNFTHDSVTNRKRSSEELRDTLIMATDAYTVENSKGTKIVRKALSDYFQEHKEFQ